jgi:hypothetical protein
MIHPYNTVSRINIKINAVQCLEYMIKLTLCEQGESPYFYSGSNSRIERRITGVEFIINLYNCLILHVTSTFSAASVRRH